MDLISRQAAIDALVKRTGLAWESLKIIHPILCVLEELPSAQFEPKRGKWKCSDDMYETAICSCCGYDTNEPWDWTREHFMFCPSCGAKMVR